MTTKTGKTVVLSLLDFSFSKLGSLEMLLINLSKRLAENNFESVVVLTDEISEEFKDKTKDFTPDFIPKSMNQFQFYVRLYKIMRQYKPDIVHIGFYPIFSPMVFLIYLCGCRTIIITDHLSGRANQPNGIKKWLVYLRNKSISRCIKKITCVSKYVLERDKRLPGIDLNKLELLYLGLDLNRFRPLPNRLEIRKEFNVPEDAFVVSTIAHLIKEKGISYFIRAAKEITESRHNTLFLIAGVGYQEEELKLLTKNLGLESKVTFLGLRNDTEKILSISDVFVCPSVWQEAFGLTNIEAMACGVPVIATKVGGIPEIIEDNSSGILVEPEDTISLVSAIERLYDNPNVRKEMSQKSLERVKKYFSLDRTIHETLVMYQNLNGFGDRCELPSQNNCDIK